MRVPFFMKIILGIIFAGLVGFGVYVVAQPSDTGSLPDVSASVLIPPVPSTPEAVVAEPVPPINPIQATILTYHTIAPASTKPETKMQKHYHITPEHFEMQMKYLADNGYHPIRFDTYAKYLTGDGMIPEKSVILTFDDGWRNQYDHAYPILVKYGFTGTFFIMSKIIGGSYMTWDQIRDLDVNGFEIASHTATHPKLTDITDEKKLHDEIFGSKEKIESEIGHTISTIAYPYYQHNETIRELVKSAGYVAARGGWSKVEDSIQSIFQLKSQEVVNSGNPFSSKAQ